VDGLKGTWIAEIAGKEKKGKGRRDGRGTASRHSAESPLHCRESEITAERRSTTAIRAQPLGE
jgi:hypothetical protein